MPITLGRNAYLPAPSFSVQVHGEEKNPAGDLSPKQVNEQIKETIQGLVDWGQEQKVGDDFKPILDDFLEKFTNRKFSASLPSINFKNIFHDNEKLYHTTSTLLKEMLVCFRSNDHLTTPHKIDVYKNLIVQMDGQRACREGMYKSLLTIHEHLKVQASTSSWLARYRLSIIQNQIAAHLTQFRSGDDVGSNVHVIEGCISYANSQGYCIRGTDNPDREVKAAHDSVLTQDEKDYLDTEFKRLYNDAENITHCVTVDFTNTVYDQLKKEWDEEAVNLGRQIAYERIQEKAKRALSLLDQDIPLRVLFGTNHLGQPMLVDKKKFLKKIRPYVVASIFEKGILESNVCETIVLSNGDKLILHSDSMQFSWIVNQYGELIELQDYLVSPQGRYIPDDVRYLLMRQDLYRQYLDLHALLDSCMTRLEVGYIINKIESRCWRFLGRLASDFQLSMRIFLVMSLLFILGTSFIFIPYLPALSLQFVWHSIAPSLPQLLSITSPFLLGFVNAFLIMPIAEPIFKITRNSWQWLHNKLDMNNNRNLKKLFISLASAFVFLSSFVVLSVLMPGILLGLIIRSAFNLAKNTFQFLYDCYQVSSHYIPRLELITSSFSQLLSMGPEIAAGSTAVVTHALSSAPRNQEEAQSAALQPVDASEEKVQSVASLIQVESVKSLADGIGQASKALNKPFPKTYDCGEIDREVEKTSRDALKMLGLFQAKPTVSSSAVVLPAVRVSA